MLNFPVVCCWDHLLSFYLWWLTHLLVSSVGGVKKQGLSIIFARGQSYTGWIVVEFVSFHIETHSGACGTMMFGDSDKTSIEIYFSLYIIFE